MPTVGLLDPRVLALARGAAVAGVERRGHLPPRGRGQDLFVVYESSCLEDEDDHRALLGLRRARTLVVVSATRPSRGPSGQTHRKRPSSAASPVGFTCPRATASTANSMRLATSNFRSRDRTWKFAVATLTPKRAPISSFESPSTTRGNTVVSLPVSDSMGPAILSRDYYEVSPVNLAPSALRARLTSSRTCACSCGRPRQRVVPIAHLLSGPYFRAIVSQPTSHFTRCSSTNWHSTFAACLRVARMWREVTVESCLKRDASQAARYTRTNV